MFPLNGQKPLRNAWLTFGDDGTILEYGQSAEKSAEHYCGAIVPGFVNAHCHVELSHLHGKFTKGSGMAGFLDQINSLRDWAGFDAKQALVEEWMDRMWKRGVSAMADISNDDSSFLPKSKSPMYTRTFIELFGFRPDDCARTMEYALSLKDKAARMGIDAAPTPHSCYTMSPEFLSWSASEALKSGYLSYHSQESAEEEQLMKDAAGPLYENRLKEGFTNPPHPGKASLLYFLDRLAAVHDAPYDENILLVHNCCLDQECIDAARKVMNNAFWAVCPLSNKFIHNSQPPIRLMRENGLAITVGTDSLSSNDDLDMAAEIYCLQQEFPEVPLEEILGWTCLNGAAFLSKDGELGSIEKGKRPGLVWISDIDGDGRMTARSRSSRII